MYVYRLVLLLILAIYYFSPIIFKWWLSQSQSWYQPFLLWAGMILMIMILHISTKNKTQPEL